MQRVTGENQSPLIVECRLCSHREYAEINISPEHFFDCVKPERRRLMVKRKGNKTLVEEVRALRSLHKKFEEMPMNKAVMEVRQSQIIDLGEYYIDEALKLQERAESLGLMTFLISPEEEMLTPQEKQGFCDSWGTPVTVGKPGEQTTVIPFGWIVIGVFIFLIILWVII